MIGSEETAATAGVAASAEAAGRAGALVEARCAAGRGAAGAAGRDAASEDAGRTAGWRVAPPVEAWLEELALDAPVARAGAGVAEAEAADRDGSATGAGSGRAGAAARVAEAGTAWAVVTGERTGCGRAGNAEGSWTDDARRPSAGERSLPIVTVTATTLSNSEQLISPYTNFR